MSNFKDSIEKEEGDRCGFMTIEDRHPVIEWSSFPAKELNKFHGRVEIR